MTHDVDTPPSRTQTPDPLLEQKSIQESRELHQQCVDLLGEIDEFQSLLKTTLRNPQLVELRQFRSNVNSEFKMLQRLENQMRTSTSSNPNGYEADPEVEMRFLHALRSSNLPFYQAVWNIARGSCAGLSALGKRFYWDRNAQTLEEKKNKKADGAQEKKPANKDKRKSVFVDIVADDGEAWVKVSTISESRLLFDMAKKGWEKDSEADFSDEDGEGPPKRTVLRNFDGEDSGEDSDDDELELIKLARDLRKAADATRVRYKHPRIHIVLPKIEEGNVPEIDDVLKEMRSYGIKVECQDSLSASHSQAKLTSLLPQPFRNFSTAVNIDCTLLLAIVSDLSHVRNIPISPNFHKAIVRQIEVEKEQPLLPTELWPAMGAHELLCTKEAAKRMCEIVETIGTESEKQRMDLVLGNAPNDQIDRLSIIQKFQALSDWEVPGEWALPIKIIDAQPTIDAAKLEGKLPSVADEVAQGLSDINHSVFMYGWATGLTTISSNRTIDKQIEVTIENSRQGDLHDNIEGPPVWICDTARSLVGKDKDRR